MICEERNLRLKVCNFLSYYDDDYDDVDNLYDDYNDVDYIYKLIYLV